jgi:RNA polymerase sigma-70 factor (ECF subfamily)
MTKAIELTDEGLLRRMMAGDENAFTVLYRRRHPSIFRFALHMSGNVAVAEDVTQEVFMTLIRDARRFDPARGSLGGFLLGVARNHLRKRWEQDRRSVPLAEDADELGRTLVGPADFSIGNENGSTSSNGSGNGNGTSAFHDSHDSFASLETVGRVRQAIQTLPENYREAVVLCDLEEMSYEEAAQALDCPVGTVRSRLHRGRAMLLEKLREPLVSRRAAVGL